MSATDTIAPHDADTLFRLAERAVRRLGVPDRWHEDAVAEYVFGAFEAEARGDCRGNIQVYQCECGWSALLHFIRRERRQENLSPGSCIMGAKRVSIDKMIRLPDGEQVPMVETIEDRNMPQPDARMLEAERREAVERAVGELPREEQSVIRLAWLKGRTQEEAAEALGMSRKTVRSAISRARAFLTVRLAEYGDEFRGRKRGEK